MRRDGGGGLTADGEVLSSVVASQAELHARYGGVVPEVASRRHLELVGPVVREALERAGDGARDVDRVAVTQGPGLVGALLVGVSAAKAIAWARQLPLVPVDHLRGHVASLSLGENPVEPPFVCLLASGGHTQLLAVRDAGRSPSSSGRRSTTPPARRSTKARGSSVSATPVVRRSTGSRATATRPRSPSPSPGCPGSTSRSAGSRRRFSTPSASSLRRSSSERRPDLAASYQRAVVRALAGRARQAAEQTGIEQIAVVGGVAANSELRAPRPARRSHRSPIARTTLP